MAVLSIAIGTSDTTIVLLSSSLPVNGGVVTIDSENILYGAATDNMLLNCVRGANGTTAASHSRGAQVTLAESTPFSPEVFPVSTAAFLPPTLQLTDPTVTLTPAQVDAYVFCNVLLDGSGVNQSWTLPAPTSTLLPHRLTVTFFSGASKTLSVNSTSIATGTKHEFIWDILNQQWCA